jgi:hypothetical protein
MDQAKLSRPAPQWPLSVMSDAELAAVVRACERLITYARYRQFLIIGELARRGLAASVDAA